MKASAILGLAAGLVVAATAQQPKVTSGVEYPTALVREEQNVKVDGVIETWRLQWAAAPKPHCDSSDAGSLTCPCIGFVYGEAGDLFLVRLREEKVIDRLHLTPLFTEESKAVVQRWPADYDRDFRDFKRDDFPAIVSNRPIARVMDFADYDHDGRKTEFLQTESAPCGKSTGVVIGLSRNNPHLHAFGTVTNPGKPLYLRKHEWEALRDESGPVEVMDWRCGDHGSETEIRVRLQSTPNGIAGTRREFSCPADESQRLIRETPL